MFLLTGAALISCEGTSEEDDGDSPDGRGRTARRWQVDAQHHYDTFARRSFTTRTSSSVRRQEVPDVASPTANRIRPLTGVCSFARARPRTRAAPRCGTRSATIDAFARQQQRHDRCRRTRMSGAVPFGLCRRAAARLTTPQTPAERHRDEDMSATRSPGKTASRRTRTLNGQCRPSPRLRCPSMLHQETHSADAYARSHERLLRDRLQPGADATSFGGKVIVARHGDVRQPREFRWSSR